MNMLDFDYDNSDHIIRDDNGVRFVKCDFCDHIGSYGDFLIYGGKNHVNLGTCRLCCYAQHPDSAPDPEKWPQFYVLKGCPPEDVSAEDVAAAL